MAKNNFTYKEVFRFELAERIKNGERVYYLDKSDCDTGYVGKVYTDYFILMVNDDTDRFYFWVVEKREEQTHATES